MKEIGQLFCKIFWIIWYSEYGILPDEMRYLSKCHLIVFDGNTLPKSYKIAYTLMNGIKLIKKQWLDDCIESQEIIDFSKYLHNVDLETRKS